MSNDDKACAVPLVEQLESVPADARLVVEEDRHCTRVIPVGRMCREAAAALRAAEKR